MPFNLRPYFEKEVSDFLHLGIIQPFSSPHFSPFVMVRKSGSVIVFDAEPTCSVLDDVYTLSGATYFSEMGFCKAYYQISLTIRAKPLTAFFTHRGLIIFCQLPLDLGVACFTYIYLRKIVFAY